MTGLKPINPQRQQCITVSPETAERFKGLCKEIQKDIKRKSGIFVSQSEILHNMIKKYKKENSI